MPSMLLRHPLPTVVSYHPRLQGAYRASKWRRFVQREVVGLAPSPHTWPRGRERARGMRMEWEERNHPLQSSTRWCPTATLGKVPTTRDKKRTKQGKKMKENNHAKKRGKTTWGRNEYTMRQCINDTVSCTQKNEKQDIPVTSTIPKVPLQNSTHQMLLSRSRFESN